VDKETAQLEQEDLSEDNVDQQSDDAQDQVPAESDDTSPQQSDDNAQGSAGDTDQGDDAAIEQRSSAVDVTTFEPAQITAAAPRELSLPDVPEIRRILNINVPLIVQVARQKLSVAEVTSFTTGTVIEFDKIVEEDLDLLAKNKCIGKGQAIKVGENYGLQVTSIGPVAETIQALSG